MKCSGYKVQIESDDGGSILEAETSTVITRFVPVHGLALGTHRWRVGAIPSELVGLGQDSDYVWSAWRTMDIVAPAKTVQLPHRHLVNPTKT